MMRMKAERENIELLREKNFVNESTELGGFALNMKEGEKSSLEGAKVLYIGERQEIKLNS